VKENEKLSNVKEDRQTVQITHPKLLSFHKMATLKFPRKQTREKRPITHLVLI
jgi:hypothetical protein